MHAGNRRRGLVLSLVAFATVVTSANPLSLHTTITTQQSAMIALNVKVRVKPARAADFVAAAERNVKATREEPGCLQIVFGQQLVKKEKTTHEKEDSIVFCFHDQFVNADAYRLHEGLPHFTEFIQTTKPLLQEPPTVHLYRLHDVEDNPPTDKSRDDSPSYNPGTRPLAPRFCLNVESCVKPALRDDYYQLMTAHARCSRQEPGCVQFDWGLDDQGNFYLHEEYTDRAAFDAHEQSAHFARFVKFNQEKDPYTQPQVVDFFEYFHGTPSALSLGKTMFVTVGTTLFDALTESMTNDAVLGKLADLGVTNLIVQYGKGKPPTAAATATAAKAGLSIEAYDFKPTLEADLRKANVVVGHAGAGTISETLALGKQLVVVINTTLMHNHQTELAYAMRDRGHVFVVEEAADLKRSPTWDAIAAFVPEPLPPGDADEFPALLTTFLNTK